jgi:flagellin
MALSILNNIAALYAENNLTSTQSSLQNTLQQLSSGSRINSGADDAAGLAVANGLGANEAALTQSSQNATAGIGLLQTADGALSQVTNLLDRAVTLATESANGTLTGGQVSSANQEYQNILSQIGNIGSTTNFNSSDVFTSSATNIVVTDGTTSGLNTYADTVGQLTTASVGTSAGTAVQTATLTPVTTQTAAAGNKQAGTYVLTPTAKTDTLAGTLSMTVGSGATATTVNVTVAPGTSTSALQTQLMTNGSAFTTAGLSATVNATTGALTITGPTTGATVAANTVTFTGTNLTDSTATTNVSGAVGTTAAPGVAAGGSLTVSNTTTGTFGGNITLQQGGQTLILSIAAGSSFGSASNSATVEGQIANQLAAQTTTTFAAGTEGGSGSNVVLNFTGADTITPITVTNTSLQRTANPTTLSGLSTQTANVGAPSTGTLAVTGASSGDDYSGSIILHQGANTKTIDITSGVMGSASTLGTVQQQIAAALDGNANFSMTSAGTGANPTIAFNGTNNTTAVSIDTTGLTTTGNGTITDSGTAGTNPTVGTYTTSVLSNSADTFGIGSVITINGEAVTLDGKTGTTAALAISQDSILSGENVSAVFSNNRLVITGNPNGAALTVSGVGNLTDVSAAAAAVTSNTGTAGKAAVAGTYVTSAMGTSSDTYGSNSILDINGNNVNISGETGSAAAQTIQTQLTAAGITAAFDNSAKTLTITGKSDGSALTVTGVNTLTDVSSNASSPVNSGNFVQGQPVQGSSAITAASTVISLLHSSDTLSGTLNVAVAGGGTGSLTITSGESGSGLASQIEGNQSFINAGITASYSAPNNAVTITGPTGAANTITVTGTVTDSTVSTPGVGANFTSGTVSQLTSSTAGAVLTTVTAAVADVAYQRGTLGADINQLTSASNVASAESVNLTSAQQSITATDYGQAASNLSKYQILSQTGISALAQANSVQQEVLKLLQ